jgi:dTDP-4-dehydrorhamnose 3,5-epimerase
VASVQQSDVIAGIGIAVLDVHGDDRGRFVETYRRQWFPGGREMVQANRADRVAGSVVGLHFHLKQADYWYVPAGSARGVYIPPGVAHGFAALTDFTLTYLVDGYYDPADELGVAWDDPDVGADWGVADPVLSGRDRRNPRRAELPGGQRPVWAPPRQY